MSAVNEGKNDDSEETEQEASELQESEESQESDGSQQTAARRAVGPAIAYGALSS
jgi:hypothetical protein